jgi:fibronectin type 3 domain-containing protein
VWRVAFIFALLGASAAAQSGSAAPSEYLCTTDSIAVAPEPTNPYEVVLNWTASSSSPVWYRVYRGVASGGPYTRIADCVSGLSYTDATAISGQTYYYVTTAVWQLNGVESSNSNQGTAYIPLTYLGSLSESLTTSDNLVRQFAGSRQPSETLSTSAALSSNAQHGTGLSESLSSNDSLARQYSHAQVLSETLSTSDSIARQAGWPESLSESLITADALSTNFQGNIGLTESLNTSDSIARQAGWPESLSESLTTSDSMSVTALLGPNLIEGLSTSDSIARKAGWPESLSETLTTSDSLTRQVGWTQALGESLTTSDALSTNFQGNVGLTESLSTSDSLARKVAWIQSLSETLTTGDSLARQVGWVQSPSESLTTSDYLSRVDGHVYALSETLTTSDSLARQVAWSQTLSESLSTSAALSLASITQIDLTEDLTTSDSLARQYGHAQALGETLSLSDSLTEHTAWFQPLSESLSTSAALAAVPHSQQNSFVSLGEALNTPDSLTLATTPFAAAPIWLRVTQTAGASVLVWRYSPSVLVTSQNLYRDGGSGFSVIAELSPQAQTFTDVTVAPGQTYFYAVTALVGTIESAYSNVVQTTTQAGVAAPYALRVTATQSGARLIWRHSETVGVTSQIVYQSQTSGGPYTAIQTLAPNTQTAQDPTAIAGQTYYYVVAAFVGAQQSGYSNEVVTTIP